MSYALMTLWYERQRYCPASSRWGSAALLIALQWGSARLFSISRSQTYNSAEVWMGGRSGVGRSGPDPFARGGGAAMAAMPRKLKRCEVYLARVSCTGSDEERRPQKVHGVGCACWPTTRSGGVTSLIPQQRNGDRTGFCARSSNWSRSSSRLRQESAANTGRRWLPGPGFQRWVEFHTRCCSVWRSVRFLPSKT